VPEGREGEPERWRIQWPRVPREILGDFARVSVTAATVWATVALFLSIVPSYAKGFLGTGNLALLATVAAVALLASSATQVLSRRWRPPTRVGQATGLALLVCGLVGLALSAPLSSLTVLLAGAILAGAGHGLAFLSAQEELNELAPADRRGEVTAAFIACIYFLVASAVIGSGLLDVGLSLSASVETVAGLLAAAALGGIAWQLRRR
jgi:Na+/melibiose symporter-like transporter